MEGRRLRVLTGASVEEAPCSSPSSPFAAVLRRGAELEDDMVAASCLQKQREAGKDPQVWALLGERGCGCGGTSRDRRQLCKQVADLDAALASKLFCGTKLAQKSGTGIESSDPRATKLPLYILCSYIHLLFMLKPLPKYQRQQLVSMSRKHATVFPCDELVLPKQCVLRAAACSVSKLLFGCRDCGPGCAPCLRTGPVVEAPLVSRRSVPLPLWCVCWLPAVLEERVEGWGCVGVHDSLHRARKRSACCLPGCPRMLLPAHSTLC